MSIEVVRPNRNGNEGGLHHQIAEQLQNCGAASNNLDVAQHVGDAHKCSWCTQPESNRHDLRRGILSP